MNNRVESPIVLVDIGARGGLKHEWLNNDLSITPIVFEPASGEADKLRPHIESVMGGRVIACALGNREETRELYLTASPGCTSVLKPDHSTLSMFSVQHAFEIRATETVFCRRFDDVVRTENLPHPDVVKIDVQGFEREVLQGFGDILDQVLGIELESHLYPLYENQGLFNHLVELLAAHGLYLRKMSSVDHFDGFSVEYDAWFTKGPVGISELSEERRRKLEIIESIWGLPQRRKQFWAGMFG